MVGNVTLVCRDAERFLVLPGMFFQIPLAEVSNGPLLAFGVAHMRNIGAPTNFAPKALSFVPCRLGRPRRTVIANDKPALTASDTYLEDIHFGAPLAAHRKPLDVRIPERLAGAELIDGTFREADGCRHGGEPCS